MEEISSAQVGQALQAMLDKATLSPEAAAARCQALSDEQLVTALLFTSPDDPEERTPERSEVLRRLTLASRPGERPHEDLACEAADLAAENQLAAADSAVERAFGGIHTIDNHDGNEPICRFERYAERGDSSVGIPDVAGWQLAADQTGTEWERLARDSAALARVIEHLGRALPADSDTDGDPVQLARAIADELTAARHRLAGLGEGAT